MVGVQCSFFFFFFLWDLKKLIIVIMLLYNLSYKQRGKLAESSNNVFFYISYEGTVDIDKILDPVSFKFSLSHILFFLNFQLTLLIIC